MTQTPLLRLSGMSKSYPGVVANDAVSLDIFPGEIHALLGENGAGKSTLVKIIYGLVKPDAGAMQMNAARFAPTEPRAARAAGVGMVFQHFSLFEALTVAENIALGMEKAPRLTALSARIKQVSEAYGLPLSPDRTIDDLSAGERQRVEIIRCLLQDPKLLIMDEPTSVLTPQEVEILFETLRKLSAEGTAILYISHKLEEIRKLCHAATILRMGKVVGTCIPAQTSAQKMAEMMVGQALSAPKRAAQPQGGTVLTLDGLSTPPARATDVGLHDISLSLARGEILGIGGVAGNGQDALLAALSGEARTKPGMIKLGGQDISSLGPVARRRLAVLSAPEERLGHAAVPNLSLTENAMLTAAQRERMDRAGLLNWSAARRFAEKIIAGFDVRTPGTRSAARALSGGNLQKFVIGREILQRPDVLVVNQPTWGVDASAASAIRQALLDLSAAGTALIVISQDLDELMEISDRFAALTAGRLSEPRRTQELSVEQVGLMLGGAQTRPIEHA
ncbi:MAG: ABC transporter ATP-binding protein [Pseudomonadota bacterium]